jgi:hypothetical protein
MIPRLLSALLLLPAAAFAAAALPIEFNGVVVAGGKIQVSLLNPNTLSAKWVSIGGKFDNYTVTSCNVNALTTGGAPIQNPSVVLTNNTTHVETTILIKSSTILATPTPLPAVGPGPGTTTTVTMGPNGPTISVGPGQQPGVAPPGPPQVGPVPGGTSVPAPTPPPPPNVAPTPAPAQ